ncbi:MAG: DUF1638 domain-containing protein [Thermodesulfobacteriota bacterium]
MKNKRAYVIACAVLALDLKQIARSLGMDLGTRYLQAGLHDNPDLLRQKLQAAIDDISTKEDCERIIIGYGVCGRGTVGVHARGIPLAIPKVHDCIALFLGGDGAYKRQFKKYPGTYYISAGWYEEKTEPISQQEKSAFYGDRRLHYDDLVDTYGKEAADETFRFLNTWQDNYQRAVYIETGAAISPKYEDRARDMAREYGWKYEKVEGGQDLLEKLLIAGETTDEILVVPPEHVITFDAVESTLSANPIWSENADREDEPRITVFRDETEAQGQVPIARIGLGIDAGGTYTDTVIYDLEQRTTLCKSKTLTTKWDFTVGIGAALTELDQALLHRVELVSLSTTLATNAIVENEGQKVGMVILPPYGRLKKGEIPYNPKVVAKGQLEINGTEIEPIDEMEVAELVRRMVREEKVRAFAVSGYAGAINPEHELAVKRIIIQETGLAVTCGHELSRILNFKTRAYTAMLNARIIPKLASLISDLGRVIDKLGIAAPIMVVKGDGTLMSAGMAMDRPVETILSGPAASVAGARYLTGLENAIVVDMGGTTTDTATLLDGSVSVSQSGSNVGGHKTHVKALDIRTTGLGGDSLIAWEEGHFVIGPKRVAPIAWLGAMYPGAMRAMEVVGSHLSRYAVSTSGLQILALTGKTDSMEFTPLEAEIVDLLRVRPHSIEELVDKTGVLFPQALRLHRLEENYTVQRCGLTLTDLLHVTGRFTRWDTEAARFFCGLFSRLTHMETLDMARHLLDMGVARLTLEILKKQLDEETDSDGLENCSVCQTLVNNMLGNGNDRYSVSITLKQPVVGIGAPIHFFLPKISKNLVAETILPENADVANAIGAITSNVLIKRHLRIIPNHDGGGFLIDGLAGAYHFEKFQEADQFAREELVVLVREQARLAGTSSREVEVETHDNITAAADGKKVFLNRSIKAKLMGKPDSALLVAN